MPFDMGFNCRNTAGFVTDPSYAVPCLNELYPHTYTNGDGKSINAGWDTAPAGYDGASGNDPRIAGNNYASAVREMTVDLSSGSAPGAGDYAVDLAVNIVGQAHTVEAQLLDNTTSLFDYTSVSLAADHYLDATGTDVGPVTTTWTGTPGTHTFATTTCKLKINRNNVDFVGLAHFRLTLQGGASVVARRLLMLGVGS